MIEKCKHSYKLTANDIFSSKAIFGRKLKCSKCDIRIEITTDKKLFEGLKQLLTWVFVFFTDYTFLKNIPDVSKIIEFGYLLLIALGFYRLMTFVVNLFFWLFRKRIKYIEIEEDIKK